MSAYTQELTVNWGESDPFGLVYYAREVAWFNEVEHELFRKIGHPINKMIKEDRSAFVMVRSSFVSLARQLMAIVCSAHSH